jgi:hypothetical protein
MNYKQYIAHNGLRIHCFLQKNAARFAFVAGAHFQVHGNAKRDGGDFE